MSIDSSNNWVIRFQPNPAAKMRLFCLPYAGGATTVFRTWGSVLGPQVEVCAVQLPGRDTRWKERPFEQLSALTPVLGEALRPMLDKPFAIFGYSVGALIGYCLTRWLHHQSLPAPQLLAVAARAAPHLPRLRPAVHGLSDALFIQELHRFGGTPNAVLENQELRELFLPVLRADFALFETYVHVSEPPLSCPIAAFAGSADATTSIEQVQAWQEHTTGRFSLNTILGGHFFVNTALSTLLQKLSAELTA